MSRRRIRDVVSSGSTLVKELCIVLAGAMTYAGVRKITEGDQATAVTNAKHLMHVERTLGINWEPHIQSVALSHVSVRDFANWMYVWGHWPVIIVSAIMLYSFRRQHYAYLRTAVFVSGMLGFLFFALVPMAPPRLANAGLIDTVSRWSGSYRTFQPPNYTNIYAAMPSLHFGWDLLVGIALFASTTYLVVRIFAVMMPMAMAFAVVATANHWVLDVMVGFAVVMVATAITAAIYHPQRIRDLFRRDMVSIRKPERVPAAPQQRDRAA